MKHQNKAGIDNLVRFTPAQLDTVVRLKIRGETDKAIAETLGKSPSWVSFVKKSSEYAEKHAFYATLCDTFAQVESENAAQPENGGE